MVNSIKVGNKVRFLLNKNVSVSTLIENMHLPIFKYSKQWVKQFSNKYYKKWLNGLFPTLEEVNDIFKVVAFGELDDPFKNIPRTVLLIQNQEENIYLVNADILVSINDVSTWFD